MSRPSAKWPRAGEITGQQLPQANSSLNVHPSVPRCPAVSQVADTIKSASPKEGGFLSHLYGKTWLPGQVQANSANDLSAAWAEGSPHTGFSGRLLVLTASLPSNCLEAYISKPETSHPCSCKPTV